MYNQFWPGYTCPDGGGRVSDGRRQGILKEG